MLTLINSVKRYKINLVIYPFKNYLLNTKWENIHFGPSNPGWFSWICHFIFFLFHRSSNVALSGLEINVQSMTQTVKNVFVMYVYLTNPVLFLTHADLFYSNTVCIACSLYTASCNGSVVVTSNHHKRHDVRMVARTHPMLCRDGERGGGLRHSCNMGRRHRLNMLVRSPKCIWAPVYSCILIGWEPATPPSTGIWAHIRGRYWSAR
jgi:hypothetical protein